MADKRIDSLKEVAGGLAPRDKVFAESMLDQYDEKEKLSPKQWVWVVRLAKRGHDPLPPMPEVKVGSLKKLYSLFENAKQHLSWPKIRLLAGEQNVCLSVAGPRSKYSGKVMVTDGEPFGINQWWGAIDSQGKWQQPNKGVPASVVSIIKLMSKDPEGTASSHGTLTGNCCFCRRALKDERSTDVGYGPKCAKNFGLAWGRG